VAGEISEEKDELVPDAQVRAELGNITAMTVHRYDRDPRMAALGWPPPVRIANGQRKYRSRRQLEQFKGNMVKAATARRDELYKKKVP
jgi:hypothetical protein